jgi:hypothetical protein
MLGCAAKKTVESGKSDIDKGAIYKESLLWVYKPMVNMRDEASGAGTNVAQLVDGDSVMVLTNENGWYQIRTIDGKSGWVRSDLLGPKELSAFPSAVKFIEGLKEKEQIEVYFDKKLYHKRIYISYPAEQYTSRTEVEEKTKELVKQYQKDVYRGQITARVLKPGSNEEYLTLEMKGSMNADLVLPIIPFGRIEEVNRDNPSGIKLSYSTPEDISDERLISTARQISSNFPISYQRVEITFKDAPFTTKKPCRLWFMEDKNGEDYKLGQCE